MTIMGPPPKFHGTRDNLRKRFHRHSVEGRPGIGADIASHPTSDRYPLFAAVAYIRAAADRASVPGRQVCQELTQGLGPLPT